MNDMHSDSAVDPSGCGRAPGAVGIAARLAPYLFSLLLTLVFYSPRFQPVTNFCLADSTDQNVPNRVHATRAIQAGRLPHWTTAIYGGHPFLSDPQSAVFYPPHLVLSLLGIELDTPAGFDSLVLAHVIVLALGVTFLARTLGLGPAGSVVASVLASHNGYIVNHLSHTVIINPIALGMWGMGLLVLALRRGAWRPAVGAGLLFASGILAGHWQTAMNVIYAAGCGGVLLAARGALREGSFRCLLRGMGILGACFLVAAAGALVQVIPTLALLRHSGRKELDTQTAMMFSVPLQHLPGLLFPGLCKPLPFLIGQWVRWHVSGWSWVRDGCYEYLLYFGPAATLLALCGLMASRRRLFAFVLAAVAVLAVLAALGPVGGIYPLLYHYAPGFKQVRIPPRLLWIGYLAAALLAGLAVDAIAQGGCLRERRRAGWTVLIVAVIFLAGTAGFLAVLRAGADSWSSVFAPLLVTNPATRVGHELPKRMFVYYVTVQLALGAGLVVLAALWCWIGSRCERRLPGLAAAAVVLLFVEMFAAGFSRNIFVGRESFKDATSPLARSVVRPDEGRLLAAGVGAWERNGGLVTGTNYIGGYNPLTLEWVDVFRPQEAFPCGRVTRENALDEWNVSHVAYKDPGGSNRAAHLYNTDVIMLQKGNPDVSASLQWKLPEPGAVSHVDLLAATACSAGYPDRTVAGRFDVLTTAGQLVTSVPLVLGENIAEWMPADIKPKLVVAHRRPQAIFRASTCLADSKVDYYRIATDLPGNPVVGRFEVHVTADAPLFLAASCLIATCDDATSQVLLAPEATGYTAVESGDPAWCVFRRPAPLGYAWMAPAAEPVSYKNRCERALARYRDPSFDPRRSVLVNKRDVPREEVGAFNAPQPETFAGRADYRQATPERIVVRTGSNQRGWLVVSMTWYSGWSATVDGKPARLLRVNGAHCGLPVDAGTHEVVLAYRTPGFLAGASVSGVAWCAAALLLLCPRRRRTGTSLPQSPKHDGR